MGSKAKHVGCSVEGCPKPHYAKTYCKSHWSTNNLWGTPVREVPEVPKVYCHCGKEAHNRKRQLCKAHYMRWWYDNRQGRSTGEHQRKAEVGYYGAHGRVRAIRGLAREFECVLCGGPATDWALSAEASDLRFDTLSGRPNQTAYSLNPYESLSMCSDCHRAYDSENANRGYLHQPSRWEVSA